MLEETILIAEDEHDIRSILHDILSGEGFNVISVSNGAQAYDFIKDKFVPDLLITDVMMPKLNGIELIETLHKEEINIPIIVYSASGHFKGMIEKLGARFIYKPFDLDALLNLAKEALYEKKQRTDRTGN